MNTVTDVAAHIKQIWSSSAFMNLLKIEIYEIHCGGATVKMPIDFDIHTNHWLGVHGGALAALAMQLWALPEPVSARLCRH